jgi:hypothetical protein
MWALAVVLPVTSSMRPTPHQKGKNDQAGNDPCRQADQPEPVVTTELPRAGATAGCAGCVAAGEVRQIGIDEDGTAGDDRRRDEEQEGQDAHVPCSCAMPYASRTNRELVIAGIHTCRRMRAMAVWRLARMVAGIAYWPACHAARAMYFAKRKRGKHCRSYDLRTRAVVGVIVDDLCVAVALAAALHVPRRDPSRAVLTVSDSFPTLPRPAVSVHRSGRPCRCAL